MRCALRSPLRRGRGATSALGINRVETCRNFGTKLWNAARFCEMNECVRKREFDPAVGQMTVNKWIVAEAARVAASVTAGLEAYRFNDAAGAIYHFVWDVFCDWYLEFIKPVLNGADEAGESRNARYRCLGARPDLAASASLHALHHGRIMGAHGGTRHAAPLDADPVAVAGPGWHCRPHEEARAEMSWLIELISGIRSVRSEMHVPPSARIALVLKDAGESTARV